MALNVVQGPAGTEGGKMVIANPFPPAGVDAGAFFDLVGSRKRGLMDNLLEIDKAENNTSVVFYLEWRGWKLLFCGDAELRSWKTMGRENILKPVDFLKVGHHGSQNATPPSGLLNLILPEDSTRERQAAVSTYNFEHYSGVPDPGTLGLIGRRCTLWNTMQLRDGGYYDIEFEG
jgi:hypothetical protein